MYLSMCSVMTTEPWPSIVWTVLGGSKRENKRLHMSLLEEKNLRTYFKTEPGQARPADGVSFTLEEGESLALGRPVRVWQIRHCLVDHVSDRTTQWVSSLRAYAFRGYRFAADQ